ncbi:hypothetical protein DPMN_031255 [Dreissena polymorpha]|uniref:Uncharacterized protein n=1 Tax=Dreissena polymorpha TaxID=45954 RepID=A0A9D4M1Z7_DREPO|nr:hypothetical protein DPMN_031255 [Dreissena polymorpha]
MDGTGISPEHRPPNVIVPTKDKSQSVTKSRSATTTIIACANAAGNRMRPGVLSKGRE